MSFKQPASTPNARFCVWHDVAVLLHERGESAALPDVDLLDWCTHHSPDHLALIALYCGEALTGSEALPVVVRQPISEAPTHFSDLDRWAAEKRRETG